MYLRQLNAKDAHDVQLGAGMFCGAPQYMLDTFGRAPIERDGRSFMTHVPAGSQPEDILIFAAFQRATPVGLMQVQRRYIHAHRANIGLLLVAPAQRRRGHGSEMLEMLGEISCSWPHTTRFAVSVLDTNTAGLAFWRQAGFRTLVQGFEEPGYRTRLTVMERATLRDAPAARGAGAASDSRGPQPTP